jgi:dCMP deaminase
MLLQELFGVNYERWMSFFMDIAIRTSQMSYATKRKVGVVAVSRDRSIIDVAFNGTPPNWSNVCEDESGDTLDDVEHAERNLVARCACYGRSLNGTTVFTTDLPCVECARALSISGVKGVIYLNDYKNDLGLEYLKKSNVAVIKFNV